MKPGGISIANVEDNGGFTWTVDANGTALHHGLKGSANVVMLGFVVRLINAELDEARSVLGDILSRKLLDDNIKALQLGYEVASYTMSENES